MNKIKKSKLAFVLIALVVSMSSSVYAGSLAESSKVTITFDDEGENVVVVDPEDPTKPLVPGETIFNKELSLIRVSNFSFGTNSFTSTEVGSYRAKENAISVQISDLRTVNDGWNIIAELAEFKKVSDNSASLAGATLVLTNGESIQGFPFTGPTDSVSTKPSITLEAGVTGGEDVTSASDTKGLGTWVTQWKKKTTDTTGINSNVVLNIPAGAAENGEHKSTVLWTLANTP